MKSAEALSKRDIYCVYTHLSSSNRHRGTRFSPAVTMNGTSDIFHDKVRRRMIGGTVTRLAEILELVKRRARIETCINLGWSELGNSMSLFQLSLSAK